LTVALVTATGDASTANGVSPNVKGATPVQQTPTDQAQPAQSKPKQ
jgi:hypothetical protein